MIALLIAAQIMAGAPAKPMPAASVAPLLSPRAIAVPPDTAPKACAQYGMEVTGMVRGPAIASGAVVPQTLDKLPRANHEIAIDRMVDGCPAPVVVRYAVGK